MLNRFYSKKQLVMNVVFLHLLTWSMTECSREVTLTCRGDADVTERGIPGAPGRKGPIGIPGDQGLKGSKGEPGENDGWMEALERIEERISILETRQQSTQDLFQVLSRKNCQTVMDQGNTSNGIYSIYVGGRLVEVYCDMETDGGGWLVFQRRIDGSQDFYKIWLEYKEGFGNLNGEFWLGLDSLHALTKTGSYQLRVELEEFDNTHAFAKYSSFSIGSEATHYQLTLGRYSGTAGDSLSYHNNQHFSTKDQDHDSHSTNCAIGRRGAWWYNACHASNLNGQYHTVEQPGCIGIRWDAFSHCRPLKHVEMKLRPN